MKRLFGLVLALCMLLSMASVACAEEPVTISFQTWNPGDSDELWEIIDAFEAEHPNIKIDYIYMPYSDHIADIHLLKLFVSFFSDAVSCNVRLNISLQILYIAERCFSHHTFGHHTSCDRNFFSCKLFKILFDLQTVMCLVIFCDHKRIFSVCL